MPPRLPPRSLRAALRLAVPVAALAALVPAAAQTHTAAPAHGTATLRAGTPYAVDFTIPATGGASVTDDVVSCPGTFMLGRPDVNLRVDGGSGPVRLYVRSSADTILLMRAPDGRWSCNDDTEGLNPALEIDPGTPGVYHVWVGLFFPGTDPAPVTLYADESERAAPDHAAPPTAGGGTLPAGFQPDPREMTVTAGADVWAGDDGCPGFYAAAPTYNLNYGGNGPLYIYARAEGEDDLTLAVNLPDGTWACNDDADGMNPGLRFEPAVAGLYGVWVGSFRSRARTEAAPQATLYVSETDGPDPGEGHVDEDWDFDFPDGYSGGEDLSRDAQPSGGTVAFRAGGPAGQLAVRAGGSAPTSVVGWGCAGYLDPAAPTAWVDYTGSGERLSIWAVAEADATLVVGLPDGSWTCNDDYSGLMPGVVIEEPRPGRYAVWVGTFLDGERQPATLHVAEGEPFEGE